MKTFTELFNYILTSDNQVSRKAAREVRKLVYSSGDSNKYKTIELIVEGAPIEYARIKEYWRQENFVASISVMYFLGNKRDKPDFLFPWLLKLLKHDNGNIRYAAVRMFEIEFGPLTYYIRCPGKKLSSLMFSAEQADYILLKLVNDLHKLTSEFWKPEYRKYKYISSLPKGVYKSIQLLMSRLENLCGKEYFDRLQRQLHTSN